MFSLASEDLVSFLDLLEAATFTADKDYKNKGARGTAVASIAEAFGRGLTIR